MRYLATLIVFLMAFGCAAVPTMTAPKKPTSEEIATADYGSPPIDYKSQIKSYFSQKLKDPESARYGQMTEPRKGYVLVRDRGVLSNIFCYEVMVFINAKNSYGGYTGEKPYLFFFRDGKIIQVLP